MHFGRHVTEDLLRAQSFDATFANALTGRRLGGAAGGANFEPALASEAVRNPFHAPNWKQSGELANDVYRKHSWARCAVFI